MPPKSIPVPTSEIHDLAHELTQAIGRDAVKFDEISRLLYSTDASNYQIFPVGVTFPKNADEVSAIHEIAMRYHVPVMPRGGGTSLAGQTVNRAIVMDFPKFMRRVRGVNADTKTVQVEPGLILGHLNQQLAGLGLMFGPDPASANRCVVGGCLGNNSSGTHSIMYRMTADHVNWLDVVLANGEKVRLGRREFSSENGTVEKLRAGVAQILQRYAEPIATRYPQTWRTVAGYALNRLEMDDIDLAQLIIGSEGTLGTIVATELRLVDKPKYTRLAIVHFATLLASLEIVPAILETDPSAVELFDRMLMDRTRRMPDYAKKLHFVEGDPAAVLAVEYYGDSPAELDSKIETLRRRLIAENHHVAVVTLIDAAGQGDFWTIRKAGLGLLASDRGDLKAIEIIEDAAVPVEHLAAYIEQVMGIVEGVGAGMSVYAHASAGCLHVRPLVNLKTEHGMRQYRQIAEQAVEAVLSFNGTTSGEHSEGILRGEFNERLFGPELMQAFREVKHLFDPHNQMNPNRIVDTPKMDDESLMRYGLSFGVPLEIVETRFDWSTDFGYAGAIEMCNGAGECRKENVGVMCPSYMATHDERDSTRGRANTLRAAMMGLLGLNGMKDERVKDVLDLCLSCKACKSECPSSVDMARIKAEFMAQYYDAHRIIPLRARIFANIHRLNELGSIFPPITNLALNMPIVSQVAAKQLGITPERQLPKLARQRFSQWWAKNKPVESRPPLKQTPILLIDTFMEYNDPQMGRALAYLMEQSDYELRAQRLPWQGCCGRPAISKGLLDQAKRMSTANVEGLAALIEYDPEVRFMMFEPSCVSALRDDTRTLVNKEYQAAADDIASRIMSVEEWLDAWRAAGSMDDLRWDHQPREIILHGHCHQKSLWGTSASLNILRAIPGATVRELDAGCCGMAGSFGYEAEHYEVSMRIAEQRLYPAVRNNPNAIIAAAGTSCREQVGHIEGRALHPVEIVAMACGWNG
ncbi:MAG: FAD-binding protein [Anaerolineae bacterium]|nr:FAD-binding protein [Anaerolineae bacterium]